MEKKIVFGDVLVDCKDALRLRSFYAELLGWEPCELYGSPAVRSGNGIVFLFVGDEDYVPPVWPEQAGKQQKQMHFDFQVSDVPEAVRKAESLGVVKSDGKFVG